MLARKNHLFGGTQSRPSQGNVPADVTPTSDFSFRFQCQVGSSLVLRRPIAITRVIGHVVSGRFRFSGKRVILHWGRVGPFNGVAIDLGFGSEFCVLKSGTYRCIRLSEHLKRPTDARTRFHLNRERCASRSQEIHSLKLIAGYSGISSSLESLPGERDGTTMWSRPGRGCPSSP
jgi:hypothetical protein